MTSNLVYTAYLSLKGFYYEMEFINDRWFFIFENCNEFQKELKLIEGGHAIGNIRKFYHEYKQIINKIKS